MTHKWDKKSRNIERENPTAGKVSFRRVKSVKEVPSSSGDMGAFTTGRDEENQGSVIEKQVLWPYTMWQTAKDR